MLHSGKERKEYSSNKYSDFERYSESEVYSCLLDKVFDWPYQIVSTRKQCVVWVGAVFNQVIVVFFF